MLVDSTMYLQYCIRDNILHRVVLWYVRPFTRKREKETAFRLHCYCNISLEREVLRDEHERHCRLPLYGHSFEDFNALFSL